MTATWLEKTFAIQAPSPTDKLVLLALARRADADGAAAAGQRELMAVTGLSERAVRDAQAALERAGLLTRGRGVHQLHFDGATARPDRHDVPVGEVDRRDVPIEAPNKAPDRQAAHSPDAAALRQAVAAEAGEWRAQRLFDTGRLEAGVLFAKSPAAAAQLRRLSALQGVEVRVGPPPARAVAAS